MARNVTNSRVTPEIAAPNQVHNHVTALVAAIDRLTKSLFNNPALANPDCSAAFNDVQNTLMQLHQHAWMNPERGPRGRHLIESVSYGKSQTNRRTSESFNLSTLDDMIAEQGVFLSDLFLLPSVCVLVGGPQFALCCGNDFDPDNPPQGFTFYVNVNSMDRRSMFKNYSFFDLPIHVVPHMVGVLVLPGVYTPPPIKDPPPIPLQQPVPPSSTLPILADSGRHLPAGTPNA